MLQGVAIETFSILSYDKMTILTLLAQKSPQLFEV